MLRKNCRHAARSAPDSQNASRAKVKIAIALISIFMQLCSAHLGLRENCSIAPTLSSTVLLNKS